MLQGKLEPEKAKKWAWERPSADGAHGKLTPKRDLTDIVGYSDLIQQVEPDLTSTRAALAALSLST
jgi:hypothetical protein